MCGIAGVFAYDRRSERVDHAQLKRTCDRLACRGPDGEGLWADADGKVAFAHRRLAIIELSPRGAQPMHSADGRYVIVFNGEIYNYRELRRQLEAKGRHFVSDSDTEVLLQLYAERGAAMVHELRGMFAFAIWDTVKNGLFLSRDTFGIKPLYYADDGRTLRFASEVKALLRGGGIDTSPEPAGHAGFFLWGHVPDPFTMYHGIRALPAGSTVWCGQDGMGSFNEFLSPRKVLVEAMQGATDESIGMSSDRIHHALRDSVSHHLVADVSVGIFLSAGIDSTVLAALTSETKSRPRTITLGFREFAGTPNDETHLAEEVARQYGCDHSTIWIARTDFERELPRFLDRMDQPTTDGLNTYFVAKAASDHGLKVALSGLGGDELFGGYASFEQVPRLVRAVGWVPIPRILGRALRVVAAPMIKRITSPKYAGLLEYGHDVTGAYLLRRSMFAPWELPELLGPDLAREGWAQLQAMQMLHRTTDGLIGIRQRLRALEATWYMRSQLLRDSDWAGMAHSVEIRVPLVDVELWRATVPLLSRLPPGKQVLATTPHHPLPPTVSHRTKTGFSTPVPMWIENREAHRGDRGLRGWARRVYHAYGAS